jgi:hypothetical protein
VIAAGSTKKPRASARPASRSTAARYRTVAPSASSSAARAARAGAARRSAAASRSVRQQMRQPGRDDLRHQPRVRVGGGESGRGHHVRRRRLGAERRRLLQHRRPGAIAIELDLDRLQAGERLLHEAGALVAPRPCDGDRGAERRMAGERHLAGRREDAVAVVRAGPRGGLDEGRLRQARLAREGEHRRVVEPVGIVDDRELVARQRDRREDVEPREAAAHPRG